MAADRLPRRWGPGSLLRAALPPGLRRLVKASPVWSLLRPRRFHAYCVGPAKSGTTSITGMFSRRYRTGHEVGLHAVIEMILLRLAGRLSREDAMRRLLTRDRELRLEMDSFNQLGFFVAELAAGFPRSRFVLTVREPKRWLSSILNQHLRIDVSDRPAERMLRQILFMPHGASYSRGEEELQRRELFPLDGYLKAWADHYRRVLDAAPAERLLVIPTDAMEASVPRLASFLSISPETLDHERSHLHRTPRDFGVLAMLDPGLVDEKVALHCDAVLSSLDAVVVRPSPRTEPRPRPP